MTRSLPPPGDDRTAFADQLRRYRRRAGLTQEELAAQVGLAAATIGALERGVRRRPYPHTRQVLADALGLVGDERAAFIALLSSEPETTAPPAPTTNLPPPRTPIIGRAGEIDTLRDLIRSDDVRLVTLTGVGGVGKTRLALEVARTLEPEFAGGVRLVQLAPVDEPALLPQALGNALGLQDAPGIPLLETVLHQLGRQPSLLVLDNCEHLVDACGVMVERLLSECPDLRILTTSREPLQVAGEYQWRVPLLGAPDLDDAAARVGDAELARYPAIELFVARARAAVASFHLTPENTPIIARICSRLGGLPLAVELAAARVSVLTPGQILTKLDDALRLLTRGSPAAPTRQQSMRATLDWSYALLDAGEQVAFARLAVFAGSFDLDAAEAVCSGPELPLQAVLDLLAPLVDKSLVLVDVPSSGGNACYRLLEPVRQYALGHLVASGQLEVARDRHLAHYLAFAEAISPALRGSDQLIWLDRLDDERHNLRAALGWVETSGETALGLRLAIALAPYWEGRGHLSEGRRWLASLLDLPLSDDLAHLRAKALLAAGRLAQWQTDLGPAADLLQGSLELARRLGNQAIVAEGLTYLGAVRRRQGDNEASREILEESLKLYDSLGDRAGGALAMVTLGVTMGNLGKLNRAVSLCEESLRRFEEAGDLRWKAITQTMLAGASLELGDTDLAMRYILTGLAGLQRVGDQTFSLFGLKVLVEILAARRQAIEAAGAVGLLTKLSETLGVPLVPADNGNSQAILSSVRDQLGPEEFEQAEAEGARLTLGQVLAELAE